MNVIFSLLAIFVIIAAALLGAGVPSLDFLFGVVFPYTAITVFLAGIIYRVVKWSRSPVPFHIPTVAGQQKSLPWIRDSKLESYCE